MGVARGDGDALFEPADLGALEGLLAEKNRRAEERNYERWLLLHRAYHQRMKSRSGRLLADELSRLSDQAEL